MPVPGAHNQMAPGLLWGRREDFVRRPTCRPLLPPPVIGPPYVGYEQSLIVRRASEKRSARIGEKNKSAPRENWERKGAPPSFRVAPI